MKFLIIPFYYLIGILFWIPTLVARQVVTGKITDANDGKPLFYASIFIANTTVGTYSDESGNYKIIIPGEGSYEIVVTYLGYKSFFHKIEAPKSFHQINIALNRTDMEIQEVVVTPHKNYSQNDVDLFWYMLLRTKPSKKGMEVLNPEKVYFYFDSDSIFNALCDEPIEIVNHEMGYHIRYVLQYFQHNYTTNNTVFGGKPFFEELTPQNNRQKSNWEKKRQEVYAVSITRFIRALYRDQLHKEGFLLTKRDSLLNKNIYFPTSFDILQKDQDQVKINIESHLFLACFSKPVTDKMIDNSDKLMFKSNEKLLGFDNKGIPVLLLLQQQFSIFPDGTYNGTLIIQEHQNQISGLSAMVPIEYNYY